LYGTLHKPGCPNFEQIEFGGKNQKFACIYAQLLCHIPKHHLEASKLAELLECKGNKIFKKYQNMLYLNVIACQESP
jgi:hypothetical protein